MPEPVPVVACYRLLEASPADLGGARIAGSCNNASSGADELCRSRLWYQVDAPALLQAELGCACPHALSRPLPGQMQG